MRASDPNHQQVEGSFANLKAALGGCIFKTSSGSEANEFLNGRLFRAPEANFQYIRYVKEGMPIFLLVDDEIWGHFEAVGDGELATKPDGAHLAQVRIKIVKQYSPMPASMFLPVLGTAVSLRNIPLELSSVQAKSLLHTFINSFSRRQYRQTRETWPERTENKSNVQYDSWGYNKMPPPPVPPDRKYVTSAPPERDTTREVQQQRHTHPSSYRRPMALEPRDYLAENGIPPPPPPPTYYPSSYYSASHEDIQHSWHRYATREPEKVESGLNGGYGHAPSNKTSRSSQTDPDREKVELEARVATLTNEFRMRTVELERIEETVRSMQEENTKLKEGLKEKESIVLQQQTELDSVRAEFFSFYDEENVTQGQPSTQQPVNHTALPSPPMSAYGFQTATQPAPPTAVTQGVPTYEHARSPSTMDQMQTMDMDEARRIAPPAHGRSQSHVEQSRSYSQPVPDQNAITRQLPQPQSMHGNHSQQMAYFYVPDNSPAPEAEPQWAYPGQNVPVERVTQNTSVSADRQALNNHERIQTNPGKLPEPVSTRQPEQATDLPQLPVNNTQQQQLPTPRRTRPVNNLGPLGGDGLIERSHSPSHLGMSQSQTNLGYQSHVAKGSQDAWGR